MKSHRGQIERGEGMTHTLGPWEAIEDHQVLGNQPNSGCGYTHRIETVDKTIHEGEAACPVAITFDIDHLVFPHLGKSGDNARLIAAAPNLLQALLVAVEELQFDLEHGCVLGIGEPRQVDIALRICREAITKAIGN